MRYFRKGVCSKVSNFELLQFDRLKFNLVKRNTNTLYAAYTWLVKRVEKYVNYNLQ